MASTPTVTRYPWKEFCLYLCYDWAPTIGFVTQSSLSLEKCVTGQDAISLFCEAQYVS